MLPILDRSRLIPDSGSCEVSSRRRARVRSLVRPVRPVRELKSRAGEGRRRSIKCLMLLESSVGVLLQVRPVPVARCFAWRSVWSFRPGTPRARDRVLDEDPNRLQLLRRGSWVQESPDDAMKDSGSTFLSSSRRQLITCRSESNVPIFRATRSH